jgi:hypothetical protein
MVMVTHGGMFVAYRLSERYSIFVRFAHPPEGRPDAHLIGDQAAHMRFYERSRVNLSPILNEDGKVITKVASPW